MSHLQVILNNFMKDFTCLSFNQIFFDFQICKILNLLWVDESDIVEVNVNIINSAITTEEFIHIDIKNWKYIKLIIIDYWSAYINTKNAIAFAAMQMKHFYNKEHQSHFFNVSDTVNLWLHHEYILFSM